MILCIGESEYWSQRSAADVCVYYGSASDNETNG